IIAVSVVSFIITKSYKGIIRHTGIKDAQNVTLASLGILFSLMAIAKLANYYDLNESLNFPMSIIVIHFLLNTFILIGLRYLFKTLYSILFSRPKSGPRILIYGAGEAGLLVKSVLKDDKANNAQIVGFVDDDSRKQG